MCKRNPEASVLRSCKGFKTRVFQTKPFPTKAIMSLFLLYTTESSFSLFVCYGLFKIRENDISKFVDERPRFRKVVDLVAFYTFESSDAPTQVKALSEGSV